MFNIMNYLAKYVLFPWFFYLVGVPRNYYKMNHKTSLMSMSENLGKYKINKLGSRIHLFCLIQKYLTFNLVFDVERCVSDNESDLIIQQKKGER